MSIFFKLLFTSVILSSLIHASSFDIKKMQKDFYNQVILKPLYIKYTKKSAFKRKREVILEMPLYKEFEVDEILELTPGIAKKYATVKRATVLRDLKELQQLNLLRKVGRKYRANVEILKAMMPSKKHNPKRRKEDVQ